MIKLAVLAVAVSVAGPTYSAAIEDAQIERIAQQPKGSEQRALSTLIRRQWFEGEARERGIVVTRADVEEELAQDFATRKALRAHLKKTRQTEADLKARIRGDQLLQSIRDQIAEPAAKSITPDEVKAYVDANPQLAPEQRTVRIVETKSRRQAIKVLARLKRGATFSSLGGTVERVERSDTTGNAIFDAALDRLTRHGRVVFKVIRHSPAKPLPRPQQEAMAWELLASQAQQRALDEFTVQFTAKWRERTTCAPRYGQHEDCGQPPTGQQTP